MDQMKDKSSISPIFSVYLTTGQWRKGSLQFGGSNVDKYTKKGLTDDDVHWADLADNKYYWTLNLGPSIKVGDEELNLNSNSKYVIMDTGMSLGMIPQSDFTLIKNVLKQDYNVQILISQEGVYISEMSNTEFNSLPMKKRGKTPCAF